METVCSPDTMALVYLQEYNGLSSRKITSENLRAFYCASGVILDRAAISKEVKIMVKYKNIRIEVRRTLHTQTKVVHKLGNELDVPISLAEYLGYVPWST